ncbi:flavin reductase [Patulibacter sp. S7RM1-6]
MPDPTLSPALPAVEARALRDAIGHFATGVTVVTAADAAGQPFGTTANAVSSVSLDPPLVLTCLRRESETLAALRDTGTFVLNVLREEQEELARRFARRADDRTWDGVAVEAADGPPRLAGTLATISCSVHDLADGGDHLIVVGRVHHVEHPDDHVAPLLFYRGGFGRWSHPAPADAPLAADDGPDAPRPADVVSTPLAPGLDRATPRDRTVGGPPSVGLLADLPDVALPSGFGDLRLVPVPNEEYGATSVIALFGEPRNREGILVHLHVGDVFRDALGYLGDDRPHPLHLALERLRAEGTGVLVYHRDDHDPFGGALLRGAGARVHVREERAPDPRPLEILRTAVADLGLRRARLLVPDAEDAALDPALVGLDVAERVPLG